MRYGEIFDYRTVGLAKAFLGKNGAFSDSLRAITESPSECFGGTFMKIEMEEECPFYGGNEYGFQFFRPVLEERRMRMTWAEILEWLARGNGFVYIPSDYYDEPHFDIYIHIDDVTDETLDMEVSEDIRIRHFGTDEIIVPTNAIYEEDCR